MWGSSEMLRTIKIRILGAPQAQKMGFYSIFIVFPSCPGIYNVFGNFKNFVKCPAIYNVIYGGTSL